LSTKIKDKEISWRRSKIIELRGYGLNQTQIAKELQVSEACISLDMQYLREQAKDTIKEYATDHLPAQYQVCLAALDTILQSAFVIQQRSNDNREKLQAMQLFKDTHITKLELLSNATTIDSALNFIRSKQQQEHKKESNDNDDSSDSKSASQVATTAAYGKQSVF
jgi:hypothetical protein